MLSTHLSETFSLLIKGKLKYSLCIGLLWRLNEMTRLWDLAWCMAQSHCSIVLTSFLMLGKFCDIHECVFMSLDLGSSPRMHHGKTGCKVAQDSAVLPHPWKLSPS